MHYVKQFNINGVGTKQVACIELHGKPNAATEGKVGVLGIDMDSPVHDVYKCVAVNGGVYTWELLSGTPNATAADNGKVLTVVDGKVVWAEPTGGRTGNIPSIDLVALGLPVIDVEGEAVTLETDTTEIRAALEDGAVRFRVKVGYRGLVFESPFTMHDIAGGLCSYAFDALGGMPMMLNLTFKEGSISANCTLLATGNGEGGDTPTEDIPTFDLANLGLPAVPMDGTSVVAQMDTAQITAALDKGPVKFAVKFLFSGMEMPAEVIMSKVSADALGMYICAYTLDFDGLPMIFNLIIQEGIVGAYYTSLTKASVPATSIDLSGLDTTGQIVETYADGSTKTTTIESDANGTPVKITDGDGNVTELIW